MHSETETAGASARARTTVVFIVHHVQLRYRRIWFDVGSCSDGHSSCSSRKICCVGVAKRTHRLGLKSSGANNSTETITTGGIQINGLGATDIDNQVEFQNSTTLGGLNLELQQRISKHYGRVDRLNEVVKKKLKDLDVWRFESWVAEKVILEWLAEHSLVTIIKVRLEGLEFMHSN